jgi:hypothetical protein
MYAGCCLERTGQKITEASATEIPPLKNQHWPAIAANYRFYFKKLASYPEIACVCPPNQEECKAKYYNTRCNSIS